MRTFALFRNPCHSQSNDNTS